MTKRVEDLRLDMRWKLADAGIDDRRVLDVLEAIPREDFVSIHFKPQSFDLDFPIPIGHGQRMDLLLEDALVAQELKLCGTERILEVGTGTGYLTVLLADLSDYVVTIERIPELSEIARYYSKGRDNIEYRVGNGASGCPELAPFDRIVVSVAVSELPAALTAQLKPQGIMTVPLGRADGQVLTCVEKTSGGKVVMRPLRSCRFPMLLTDTDPADSGEI